ncbi:MAG: response regulator [Nitrospirae bacterium]|nr:response regulator [Nitrospirota bacterium]
MFKVLIADDDFEDRELLKLEIQRSLGPERPDIRFSEAASIRQAMQLLTTQVFDLMTLDIEFDKLNEGLNALPEIFENHPTLNIIVISGKLNKSEVLEQLFRFTKDNVLKEKRWARHFDVLDKKDDKTEALRRAYSYVLKQQEGFDKVRELFLLAESYLEKDMIEKCMEIYQKIQDIAPGEHESRENIHIFKSAVTPEQARENYRNGDMIVASLLLGHCLETRLKLFTRRALGQSFPLLSECFKALESSSLISKSRIGLFHKFVQLRNRAIHHPGTLSEKDFDYAVNNISLLDEQF